MKEHTISRRGFVAGAAGVTALAGCAGAASAADLACAKSPVASPATRVNTLCAGCTNGCGAVAWQRDGRIERMAGQVGDAQSAGYLCGRGQGAFGAAYSEERLTSPMRRTGDKLVECTWDEVLPEIASRLTAAGSKLAVMQSAQENSLFAKRFCWAAGSANWFDDAAVRNAGAVAAARAVLGRNEVPVADVAKADFALLLGRSIDECSAPGELAGLSAKHAEGAGKTTFAGPRLTALGRVCDAWLPVRAGSELALLLAVAQQLIYGRAYDAAFVDAHVEGFAAFAEFVKTCTPKWAAEICDVPEGDIVQVAAQLGAAAPHACVSVPAGGSFGTAFGNSFDACRAALMVNALLGNFNQSGGLLFAPAAPVLEELEIPGVARVSAPEALPAGAASAAACKLFGASCTRAVSALRAGEVTAAVVVGANPVRDWPGGALAREAFEGLDCLVVADRTLTETAELADYVLPLQSLQECAGQPHVRAGLNPQAALRMPAGAPAAAAALSVEDAFSRLAKSCGLGDALAFSLEDANRAWCDAAGVSYDALAATGVTEIPGAAVVEGAFPSLGTASGKVQFASAQAQEAGISALPAWTQPLDVESVDAPRLLVGQDNVRFASATQECEQLTALAESYKLDCAWIGAELADSAGIATGDEVKLATSEGSARMRAHVTSLIRPDAVWVPAHDGAALPLSLVPLAADSATGAAMTCEVLVSIEKAGA